MLRWRLGKADAGLRPAFLPAICYYFPMRRTTLLFTLLFLLLAGCTAGTPPSTVSFMVFGDVAELNAYEELVAAFSEAHPEIEINLQHVPSQGEYRQRLATSFSSGEPPD